MDKELFSVSPVRNLPPFATAPHPLPGTLTAGNLETMFCTEDTIAAISTSAGAAPRAIVRLSGPDAISIAARLFTSAAGDITELRGFRGLDGLVRLASR
ncbi:hypothetical protein LCGC14_2525590, partial [marine sediment metagenome]